MLDRCKLIKQINESVDNLFIDNSTQINIAKEVWKKIESDTNFKYRVKSFITSAKSGVKSGVKSGGKSNFFAPEWEGQLGQTFKVKKNLDKYIVLSVDGSQIYPDRHAGTFCYLINIGSVVLNYGLPGVRVFLNSEPYVFGDFDFEEFVDSPTELVNCIRQEYEFNAGYNLAINYKQVYGSESMVPMAFLFDGSIIFWHLDARGEGTKKHFLAKYLDVMNMFYQEKMLMAGYISLTKSKELINLIRLYLCDFDTDNSQAYKAVNCLSDAVIASFYLNEFERTIVFKNNSKITEYYPDYLRPHFFYMNVGHEIARVEIPAWIAEDEKLVDMVANIAMDQSIKGMGYPVVIAESHEQAVVKGVDREFFYHLIDKAAFQQNRRIDISQKSRKKLGMGV